MAAAEAAVPGGRRRGGGGGGGGNPINRVYESNGPDVKVRGTAQTIAEKYMQLARDAHSSGDTVMVESYNQHAEHYLRILAAAQAYNQQHMTPQQQQNQQQYRRPGRRIRIISTMAVRLKERRAARANHRLSRSRRM